MATSAELPEGDEDGQPLIDALAAHGVRAENAVWDDRSVDWSRFDLVVVRSAWGYAERRDAFLAWARSLRHVLNPVGVLEWNTDKQRYLSDLEQAGVAVVPTLFVEPGGAFEPPDEAFVVKPSVSAGGRSSARFASGEVDAARALIERIHGDGRVAMVQPFLGEIEETALVYLGGEYSHALRRRVPLPPAAADVFYLEEELAAAQAGARERSVADAALAAAPSDLLYARVDIAEGMVIELELAEPSLYLSFGEGAAERFAAAINQRLRMNPEKGRTTSQ